jgi:VIT1/CCC1 family predicted Fe2+/Mn2+ transporter
MVIPEISTALFWSAVMTLASMAGFGFLKGHFTGQSPWRSGLHTMLIGGLAASAAFAIARAIA